MIEGLFFGVLAYLSFILSWYNLPKPIKNFSKKHPLLTDLVGGGIMYMLISSVSKSLVAIIAAVFGGLLIDFTIHGVHYYEQQFDNRSDK